MVATTYIFSGSDRCIRILQESIDVFRNVGVLKLGAVTLHGLTILVDEKLLKVPGDVGPSDWRPLDGLIGGLDVVDKIRARASTIVGRSWKSGFQICPQGLLVCSIHGAFGHDVELGHVPITRANMLKGFHELEIRVVALMSELIARETKDGEFVAVLFRQGVQLSEIPDSRASHRRNVVDQHDLTLELSKVKFRSLDGGSARATTKGLALEVVKGCHGVDRGALGNGRGV